MAFSVDCQTFPSEVQEEFKKIQRGEGNEDFAAKSFCKKKMVCEEFFHMGLIEKKFSSVT